VLPARLDPLGDLALMVDLYLSERQIGADPGAGSTSLTSSARAGEVDSQAKRAACSPTSTGAVIDEHQVRSWLCA
jgi:hypothetical protein